MNKIQEATLLLKKFGYRILKESIEGMDDANITDTVAANEAVKELIKIEGYEEKDASIDSESTDDVIYVDIANRKYLICKNYDVAYDKAVEDNKNFLESDVGLKYCGIDLKRFGRNWKEFIDTENHDLDLDEIDADPSYEGIDWEDAKSVSEYFDDEYIDWQKVSEFCVDEDGPANTLASYDNKDISLSDDYIAYRQR
jgi:hypothetical protein